MAISKEKQFKNFSKYISSVNHNLQSIPEKYTKEDVLELLVMIGNISTCISKDIEISELTVRVPASFKKNSKIIIHDLLRKINGVTAND